LKRKKSYVANKNQKLLDSLQFERRNSSNKNIQIQTDNEAIPMHLLPEKYQILSRKRLKKNDQASLQQFKETAETELQNSGKQT
jgi:hypothetical protein